MNQDYYKNKDKRHFIKSLNSKSLPSVVVSWDCEATTHNIKHSKFSKIQYFLMGAFVIRRYRKNKKGEETFTKKEYIETNKEKYISLFHNLSISRKRTILCYAHNAKYDIQLIDLVGQLKKLGWSIKSYIVDQALVIIKLTHNKTTLVLLDSMQIWRMSLAQVAKDMGLKDKGQMPEPENIEDMKTYCMLDTNILSEALHRYREIIREDDLGPYAYTAAGQSMNTFRYKFMKDRTLLHIPESKLTRVIRNSYVGGRCETNKLGEIKGNINLIDVNSMYPHVMREYKYPTTIKKILYKDEAMDYIKDGNQDIGFVVCEVDIHKRSIPVRIKPNNNAKYGYIIWPIGNWEVILSGPEALYMQDCFEYINVNCVGIYDYDYIFRDYVDLFWNKRLDAKLNGNKSYDAVYKLILNSLYGKMGQQTPEWVDTDLQKEHEDNKWLQYDESEDRIILHRDRYGIIQKMVSVYEHYNSMPAIASSVTSYGRCLLRKLYDNEYGIDTIYCDTDGVIINSDINKIKDNITMGDKLGNWSLEWVSDFVDIKGRKDYIYNSGIKRKGVPKSAKQLADNIFKVERLETLEYCLSNKIQFGIPVIDREIVLNRVYRHGIVNDDKTISPYQNQEQVREYLQWDNLVSGLDSVS